MPVYNEARTIMDVLDLVRSVDMDKEIVIVDDMSADGTREILRKHFGEGSGEVRVFYHEKNRGKGAALRTALSKASGDYVIVQDADLEYSPHDMLNLLRKAEETGAEAVYGSRFLKTRKSTSLVHFLINNFLTQMTNILYGGDLTDMETCYKMIKTSLIKELGVEADRFEFEPEITAKLLKKGVEIKEVPVSYRGRSYDEGKKITWTDGLEALGTLIKYKFKK
ncbi:MAG: glycosyltransferase [Candidatus Omnitrophica bacterium]|nr:glycosyltransferase [Candidatus Omnitrophota bacterium]